jgi:hypothetical protein
MDNIQQAPAIHNRHIDVQNKNRFLIIRKAIKKSNALVPELKVLGESWRPTVLIILLCKTEFFIIIYNN